MIPTILLIALFAAGDTHSTYRIEPEGHGPGRDLVIVDWKTDTGAQAGQVQVPITGAGRTGPVSVQLRSMEVEPNLYEWDTREWQWWKDCPFDPDQMRPREASTTTGGADLGPGGVRVWSRYLCDGIETTQEWFFADLPQADQAVYDCVTTVRNLRDERLEEYGQFFASYTRLNGTEPATGKAFGHFYVDEEGQLVNYRDVGSVHLEYYVTERGSMFDRLGYVPHCPRGGGKVKDHWRYPVSISLASPRGYRHVVMTDRARTAAIAQGMHGIAQDYLIYPRGAILEADGSFSVHIRHLLVPAPEKDLLQQVDRWWSDFERDHAGVHGLSREVRAD